MRTAFARYALTGGIALLLHLTVLEALLLGPLRSPEAATSIGFVAACAFNYTLQRQWVFGGSRSAAATLPRYAAVTLATLMLNVVLFAILVRCRLPPPVAQTTASGCVFVMNFHANRRLTFG
jgi:putative flippase GtrA